MSIYFTGLLQTQRSLGRWESFFFSLNIIQNLFIGESLGELQRISGSSDDLVDQLVRNSQCQKVLALNGDILLSKRNVLFFLNLNEINLDSINIFVDKLDTLINKTMEDTLMTIKAYENSRLVLIWYSI